MLDQIFDSTLRGVTSFCEKKNSLPKYTYIMLTYYMYV